MQYGLFLPGKKGEIPEKGDEKNPEHKCSGHIAGDPKRIRTADCAVRGRRLNHLTMGPFKFARVYYHTGKINASRYSDKFSLRSLIGM